MCRLCRIVILDSVDELLVVIFEFGIWVWSEMILGMEGSLVITGVVDGDEYNNIKYSPRLF